jgi:hypothetical protein
MSVKIRKRLAEKKKEKIFFSFCFCGVGSRSGLTGGAGESVTKHLDGH